MFGHDNQNDENDNEIKPAEQSAPVAVTDDHVAVPDDSTDDGAASSSLTGFTATPAPMASAPGTPPPAATDDLLDIKQEALQALTPLVSQLDQTPEEQFRTTMMMIQASDNHALVKVAYAAAKQISNEKERAQALLDIVNEINYFTQNAAA